MTGEQGRKAAIFGASGGIGAALAEGLADRGGTVLAGSRSGHVVPGTIPFTFDFDREDSIAVAVAEWRDEPPELVITATGALTLPDGTGPELSFKAIDAAAMARIFHLNTVGPAMIARCVLPLLPRDRRSVFAALSARVGSIGDNRLGGWHSYRASKAALNMLLRNFAIEMRRTHPHAVIAGLHPGTVDTALSGPFQSGVPQGQLQTPAESARHLIAVVERLQAEDSGGVFDWRGDRLPD